MIIAPGYIDLQINGAYGIDFTKHPEQVDQAAKKLLQHGVTAFLPTVISSKQEVLSLDYQSAAAQKRGRGRDPWHPS
jgi:N-acetylglucosamine-6-phosphate deacetylase